MPFQFPRVFGYRTGLLALGLGLLVPTVLAQSSPYFVGGAVGLTRETNIFRAADGRPESDDTVTSVSLLAGVDQPIGRQRVFGRLNVRENRYAQSSLLNNLSYGVNAGLDWSTLERLSGNLSLDASQNLARFSPGDAPGTTERNIEKSMGVAATVRVGVVTRMTAELGLSHREVDYSAPEFNFREYRQDAVSIGLQYQFSGSLGAGMLVRHTEGSFPLFREIAPSVFIADTFKRDDAEINLRWTPGGASTISARIAASDTRHKQAKQQDVNGVTGAVGWNWRPTGRLRLDTTLTRNTGLETTGFTLFNGLITGQNDNSRLITSLRVAAAYDLTGKIGLTASATHAQRSLSDTQALSFGQPVVNTGNDRSTSLALGVRWVPLRSLQLSCDVSQDSRTTSGTLSLPYGAGSAGCFAQFVLQ